MGTCEYGVHNNRRHAIRRQKGVRLGEVYSSIYIYLGMVCRVIAARFALGLANMGTVVCYLSSVPPFSGITYFPLNLMHPHIHPHPEFPSPPHYSHAAKKSPNPYRES